MYKYKSLWISSTFYKKVTEISEVRKPLETTENWREVSFTKREGHY